jgi:hypothetical protein
MKKIILFVAFTFVSFANYAQTVDEIVAKYLKAIGGAENWKKLESQKMEGFVVVQGLNIPFVAYNAKPNLSYQSGEFQGQKFIEAYDGKVAWSQNPFAGIAKPTQKNEEETREAAKENFEDELIDFATKGHTLELNGTEEMDGVKCHKITMKRKQGDEKIYFFDTESGVPVCVRSYAQTGQMKGMAIDSYMSDYKEVGGLMIPHTIEQKTNGQTFMTIKADKYELNAAIDKKVFSIPE